MNICVCDLSSDVTRDDLREVFEVFGCVETASVVRRHDSDESRGFGFVGMPVRSEAISAILGVHGRNLKGHVIAAHEVRPREPVSGACRTRCNCRSAKSPTGNAHPILAAFISRRPWSWNSLGGSVRRIWKMRWKLGVQYWSDDTILVNLPWRLQEHDELQRVMEMVQRRSRNVVVDFSRVGVAGGATLTRLLELRRLLQDHGRKLILCSVAPATRSVFTITRLDEVFDFVKDKFAALACLQVLG